MAEGGAAKRKAQRDRERAAEMKRLGIERTTGRCPNCYKIVVSDSSKSKNKHIGFCWR
jgi:hypothetical protein